MILDAAQRALAGSAAAPLTMRGLANELGADPTAVYRHFEGKEDLLGALTDRLLEPLAVPEPAPGWREQLEALAHGLNTVFDRYPGAVAVLAESPFTESSLRAIDATVSELIARGLSPDLAAESCRAIIVYVIGHAASSWGDPDGFWSGMSDPAVPDGQLPALRRTAEVWRTTPDEQFRLGLELLLDGVGVRASSNAPG